MGVHTSLMDGLACSWCQRYRTPARQGGDLYTGAFSTAPLRALTGLGMALSAVSLSYGAWVVAEYFISGIAVPGYATIVVGMMFFSGIQLLSMGVLAEYVGRIYEEVKQRPTYLVSQREGLGLTPPARSRGRMAVDSAQTSPQSSLL